MRSDLYRMCGVKRTVRTESKGFIQGKTSPHEFAFAGPPRQCPPAHTRHSRSDGSSQASTAPQSTAPHSAWTSVIISLAMPWHLPPPRLSIPRANACVRRVTACVILHHASYCVLLHCFALLRGLHPGHGTARRSPSLPRAP